MSGNAQDGKGSDLLTNLGMGVFAIVSCLAIGIFYGARRKDTWTKECIGSFALYAVLVLGLTYSPGWNTLDLLHLVSPKLAVWINAHVAVYVQSLVLIIVPFFIYLFGIGGLDWIRRKKLQNSLDHLGLKTSTGLTPQVVREIPISNGQKKILVKAVGIDVADVRAKKGALESSFNSTIQDIRVAESNKQVIEIVLVEKDLPKLVLFEEAIEQLKKPYTFVVGKSADGYILGDLRELHHVLIAGATGGGKSGFFKQLLIGLLRSSEHIQLYLIDLKRGVETKPFEVLSNVRRVIDSVEANACLEAIVAEMDRRYRFLEEKGFTEINPVRDGLDRIIVGIDEASVLFTIEKSSKINKANAQNARELTDKLAKLGRAAGIHVILATQKVVKETIDTRVQTNINARICFRVNTVMSSMTVLGNKMAAELPEIPGRGVWSVGSRDTIIQVPRLTNEETVDEITLLTEKFNNANSPLKQKLVFKKEKTSRGKNGFTKKDESANEFDGAAA